MNKRKYEKGDRIVSLDELVKQEFMIFNDKVYHRGFFLSWQMQTVCHYMQHGGLFKAERKADEPASSKRAKTKQNSKQD